MTTLLIILYAVLALLLIVVLIAIISVLQDDKEFLEMKLERYMELYHDVMNGIDKHLY